MHFNCAPLKMHSNQALFLKCILFSAKYDMRPMHKPPYFMQVTH